MAVPACWQRVPPVAVRGGVSKTVPHDDIMQRLAKFLLHLQEIDQASRQEHLQTFLCTADPLVAACCLALLVRPLRKRLVPRDLLRGWGCEAAAIPGWLFDVAVRETGDFAETAAAIIPEPVRPLKVKGCGESSEVEAPSDASFLKWFRWCVEEAPGLSQEALKPFVLIAWAELELSERELFNRLLLGTWRSGVTGAEVCRVLAGGSALNTAALESQLQTLWPPTAAGFLRLISAVESTESVSACCAIPWTSCHASLADEASQAFGTIDNWIIEWLWRGPRLHILREMNGVSAVSVETGQTVRLSKDLQSSLMAPPPGTVFDAVVVPSARTAHPASTPATIGTSRRSRVLEVDRLMFLDLPRCGRDDLRNEPLTQRREQLERLVALLPRADGSHKPVRSATLFPMEEVETRGSVDPHSSAPSPLLAVSPELNVSNWAGVIEHRARSRSQGRLGVILKPRSSIYSSNPAVSGWREWRREPLQFTLVLMSVRLSRSVGTRSALELTLGAWQGASPAAVARVTPQLPEEDVQAILKFAQDSGVAKYGPVRVLPPVFRFEVSCDAVHRARSGRAGVQLRECVAVRRLPESEGARVDSLETLFEQMEPGTNIP